MSDVLEYILNPQTFISLGIAIAWFRAWYKVLEHRVANNEKDIKEMQTDIKNIKDNQSAQMEDIKSRMASIDIKVNEVSINVARVMDLLKKRQK